MDNKFYISFEVAKLLKEKGCDIERDFLTHVYKENGHLYWSSHEDLSNELPAYTKDEVIDWLESKMIVIIVDEHYIIHEEDDYYTLCWGYHIIKDNEDVCIYNSSEYKTRLEAEDAAIIKACELLENGD